MIYRPAIRAWVALVIALGCNLLLWCHPHVFIDSTVQFIGSGQELRSIEIQWRFDEVYSASFFHDFKKPANNVYEGKALAKVKKDAFDDIAEDGYFTDLRVNNQKIPIKTVRNFGAKVDRGWLLYSFTIDVVAPTPAGSTIDLDFFDNEYFIAFYEFDPKQLSLSNLPSDSQTKVGSKTVNVQAWGKVQISVASLKIGNSQ